MTDHPYHCCALFVHDVHARTHSLCLSAPTATAPSPYTTRTTAAPATSTSSASSAVVVGRGLAHIRVAEDVALVVPAVVRRPDCRCGVECDGGRNESRVWELTHRSHSRSHSDDPRTCFEEDAQEERVLVAEALALRPAPAAPSRLDRLPLPAPAARRRCGRSRRRSAGGRLVRAGPAPLVVVELQQRAGCHCRPRASRGSWSRPRGRALVRTAAPAPARRERR